MWTVRCLWLPHHCIQRKGLAASTVRSALMPFEQHHLDSTINQVAKLLERLEKNISMWNHFLCMKTLGCYIKSLHWMGSGKLHSLNENNFLFSSWERSKMDFKHFARMPSFGMFFMFRLRTQFSLFKLLLRIDLCTGCVWVANDWQQPSQAVIEGLPPLMIDPRLAHFTGGSPFSLLVPLLPPLTRTCRNRKQNKEIWLHVCHYRKEPLYIFQSGPHI